MFGSHQMCTLFSTRSPYLAGKHSNLHSITAQDGPSTVTLRMGGQGKRQYTCFDEAFFKNLEKIQWNGTTVTWSSFLSWLSFQTFEVITQS